MRGSGGAHFGVVTSLSFRTVPAEGVTCFKLAWPSTRAAAMIDVLHGWAPSAADDLAASLLVNAASNLDEPSDRTTSVWRSWSEGQTVLATENPDSAAERKARDPDRGAGAGSDREPERLEAIVDLAQLRTRSHRRNAVGDRHGTHWADVDQDPVGG